jgi:hypothetical protein
MGRGQGSRGEEGRTVLSKRLTDYQVEIVRGWAREHKRAGLDEAEAARRCCVNVDDAEHTREIVSAVYASKDRS